MRTKRFLAGFLSAVLLATSLGTAALAAPASSYSYNGHGHHGHAAWHQCAAKPDLSGRRCLPCLQPDRAPSTTFSSLKDIKYYFYDFDGNLTYEYDGSMSLGQHFSDGLCKMLLI